VRTFNTINHSVLPEDKRLLVGLLKTQHKDVLKIVVLLPEKNNIMCEDFYTEKADFSKLNILMLIIHVAFKTIV